MWLSQELIAHNQIQAPVEAGEAPCELVGEEIQRLSVVLSLPKLLETEESCLTRIVPKVQSALPTGSTELHMAASSAFKQILERKLVTPRTFTQIFLQSILQSLEARDPVISEAWLETLLDVIDLLPVDVITSDILPIAQSKGQLAQTVLNRLTSSRLMGKMCSRFDQNTLKKLALPLVMSLCQDVKADVRACICSQLPAVAKGLGPEAVKPLLLPSLVELASDEECPVRNSAVETIVKILPHLQRDTLKQTIVPLVKKICEASLRAEDDVMVTMSKVYGELCLGLEAVLTPVEKKWFLSHYQMMAQLGVRSHAKRQMPDLVPTTDNADKFSDCRHNCAFHLPAMTVFATSASAGDSTFYEQLYPTFSDLACDPYFVVRKTIACGLHEVVRVLGSNNGMVKMELIKLLKDDEEEVLHGIIAKLSTTLLLLAEAGTLTPDAMDSTAIEIGRSLIKCESVVALSNDWRLHETLLRQFECLPKVLPHEFLFSHIVTTLFSRIHNARQLPVRLAASRTLLFMLRYNPKLSQKNDIRTRIITEMCHARSCYSRMGFIKLAGYALDIFSKKYFKDHFFMHILNSADDKVANNRLVFVFLLPRLKACLRLPSDKKQLVMLETCVRKLIAGERDRDVSAAVRVVIGQLDKIEVRQDHEKLGTREETEDNRRLEEENAIANLANTKVDSRAMGLMTKAINEDSRTGGNRTAVLGATSPGQSVMQRRNIGGQDLKALASLSPKGSATSQSIKSATPSASPTPSPSNLSAAITPPPAPAANKAAAGVGAGRGAAPPPAKAAPPPTPRKMSVEKNLEEEFYVDAGVRLPFGLAAAPAAASRIPNGRQAFGRRAAETAADDALCTALSDLGISTHGEDRADSAGGYNEPRSLHYGENKGSSVNPTTVSRRESTGLHLGLSSNGENKGNGFGASQSRLEMNRLRLGTSSHGENKGTNATRRETVSLQSLLRSPSRRHSFVEAEKPSKPDVRIVTVDNSRRRHSYMEKVQVAVRGEEWGPKREENDARRGTKPIVPMRRPVGSATTVSSRPEPTKRRSMIAMQSPAIRQGSDRRHSLLERDVPSFAIRFATKPKDEAFSERGSFHSRLQRPIVRTDRNALSCTSSPVASRSNSPAAAVRASVARGRQQQQRTAPNSRSSSPTGAAVRLAATRGRQLRTAPSSRVASPTGAEKRLSLGAMGGYGGFRVTEGAGGSRLPVRKK